MTPRSRRLGAITALIALSLVAFGARVVARNWKRLRVALAVERLVRSGARCASCRPSVWSGTGLIAMSTGKPRPIRRPPCAQSCPTPARAELERFAREEPALLEPYLGDERPTDGGTIGSVVRAFTSSPSRSGARRCFPVSPRNDDGRPITRAAVRFSSWAILDLNQ